jgi:hypothetical protein
MLQEQATAMVGGSTPPGAPCFHSLALLPSISPARFRLFGAAPNPVL